jgi:hypothetical protein
MSFIFGTKAHQLGIKAIAHGKGIFEEFESVGGNVIEGGFVLLLDQFFEGADVLGALDLDREDVTGIIAENYAIELECERHATSM